MVAPDFDTILAMFFEVHWNWCGHISICPTSKWAWAQSRANNHQKTARLWQILNTTRSPYLAAVGRAWAMKHLPIEVDERCGCLRRAWILHHLEHLLSIRGAVHQSITQRLWPSFGASLDTLRPG